LIKNMIKHVWSILCEKSILDQETNNVSITNAIEQLNLSLKGKPDKLSLKKGIYIPFNLEIVTFLCTEDVANVIEGEYKIEIKAPDGKLLQEYETHVQSNNKRLRVRNRNIGLKVIESGVYKFNIFLKEKGEEQYRKVAELPVEVMLG